MLGRNCNLPNTLNYIFPSLDKSNFSSDSVKDIYALYSARQASVCLESSNKIKLTLKKNIRNYQQFYVTNEMFYYKREDSPECKDPAKILGQGGPIKFPRQGTRYIKVHVCRLQSIKYSQCTTTYIEKQTNVGDNATNSVSTDHREQNERTKETLS